MSEVLWPVKQSQYEKYIVVARDISDQSAGTLSFQGIDKAYIKSLFHILSDVEQIGVSGRPDYYDYILLGTTTGAIFRALTFGFVLLER